LFLFFGWNVVDAIPLSFFKGSTQERKEKKKRTYLPVITVFCFVRKLIPLGQEIRVLCGVVDNARMLANFFDKFAKPQVQPLVPLS
jgi:hypothetical protein